MEPAVREAVEKAVGHHFADESLLKLALTHASVATSRVGSNERLEFLGDAVLGMVVCQMVYTRYPMLLEGEMTKIKSAVVSRQTCAVIARQLGLERALTLGKGMMTATELPSSLAAAALEAVIGALFLDAGYEAAAKFLGPKVAPLIDEVASSGHQQNFKSVLQQHAQQEMGATPIYRIMDEQGPDHAKAFKICAEIAGRRFEASWGQSKKKAEQMAALHALRELGVVEGTDDHVRVIAKADAAATK